MLAKGTIANFASGVSQQAVALRLPTQSAMEVNTYPAIVDGNKKRPPTEYVCSIPGLSGSTSAFSHFIVRDEVERYLVAIDSGTLQVVDLAGNAKTVNTPNGVGYLSATGAAADAFDALTIADYTFIVNKQVVTAMGSSTAATRLPEALVNIAAGNYGKSYQITINGTVVGRYDTPDGTDASQAQYVDTTYICAELIASMTGDNVEMNVNSIVTTPMAAGFNSANGPGYGSINPATGWQVKRYGNAIWIQSMTGAEFTISVADGYNGNAAKLVKGQAQRFTDLPSFGPDGFVSAVVGDQGNANAVYYVKAVVQQTGDSKVIWKECPKPGSKLTFDAATMPHILVREADGTFTFKVATWNNRVCGDDTTSPDPSMIGNPITHLSFYKNRLLVLAGGNVITSKAGDFFNFFRTSAITLLDDDPIDVNAASTKVAYLRAAVPYQQSLVVWSDLEQFSFQGNDLLTPKTANMNLQSGYESLSKSVAPVPSPRRIFFAMDRNGHVSIREWYNDMYYHISTADEASSHVPTFIPSGLFKMALSNIDDVLVMGSTADRSAMWVYKYYWSGQDKLQSAWVKWTFSGATLLNFEFINGVLYLFLKRGSTVYLEKVRMNPNLDDGPGIWPTMLDRRVISSTGTYDVGTNRTTYTLPYAPTGPFHAVSRQGGGLSQYVDWNVQTVDGNVITLDGNTTAYSFYFGESYETRYTFSPQFVRQPGSDGQTSTVQEGRLQLLKMDIAYSNAGYFRVEVTPPGRNPYMYEFFDETLGDVIPDLDSNTPLTGVFTFPVMARSDDVLIEIVNDSFLPSSFIRAEWKGNFVPKARK